MARVLGRMESPAANGRWWNAAIVGSGREGCHRGCDRRAPGAWRHRMAFGRVRCRAMPTSSEVRRQLTVILGGVILIVLITLIPDLAPPSPDIGAPVEAYKGEILEIIPPDVGGSEAGGAPVFTAQVLLLDGALKGQTVTAFVEGPGGSQLVAAYAPGRPGRRHDHAGRQRARAVHRGRRPLALRADRGADHPVRGRGHRRRRLAGRPGARGARPDDRGHPQDHPAAHPAGRAAAPDGGRRRDGDHGRDDPAHGGLGQGQRRGHPWHGGLAVGGGPHRGGRNRGRAVHLHELGPRLRRRPRAAAASTCGASCSPRSSSARWASSTTSR